MSTSGQGVAMGLKSALLSFSRGTPREAMRARERSVADPDRTGELLAEVFPGRRLTEVGKADVDAVIWPPEGMVFAGRFPGLDLVCCREWIEDPPTELTDLVRRVGAGRSATAHLTHSTVDLLAFARWEDGVPRRALSVNPDDGIVQDLGERLPVELPYWEGRHPVEASGTCALPFSPLELGGALLERYFGVEGDHNPDGRLVGSGEVILTGFRFW
ncbi:hypothetical protein [Streptomyces sp. NPDC005438]|uniref:DUF6928 family protein n=1 Tax=Streptomyces sp. NPDC005438 TaxID=3156880 RepID=UPI0033B1D93B